MYTFGSIRFACDISHLNLMVQWKVIMGAGAEVCKAKEEVYICVCFTAQI